MDNVEKITKIFSNSGYNVSSKIYLPKEINIKAFVIACHGFGGDKESTAIALLAKELNKNNIAVISFDFPGHGESEVLADKLTIKNCMDDINSVGKYIKEIYGNVKIGIFATSFGAYITILNLLENKSNYFTIVLRSPAICMDKVFKNSLLKEDFNEFIKRGYSVLGYERKMDISYDFYEALVKNDLFLKYNIDKEIYILHGTKDDIVPIEDIIDFIKGKNIILEKIYDADHRMKNDNKLQETIDFAVKYILNCDEKIDK